MKSDFDRSRKLLNTLLRSRTAVIESQNKNNMKTDVSKLNNRKETWEMENLLLKQILVL